MQIDVHQLPPTQAEIDYEKSKKASTLKVLLAYALFFQTIYLIDLFSTSAGITLWPKLEAFYSIAILLISLITIANYFFLKRQHTSLMPASLVDHLKIKHCLAFPVVANYFKAVARQGRRLTHLEAMALLNSIPNFDISAYEIGFIDILYATNASHTGIN